MHPGWSREVDHPPESPLPPLATRALAAIRDRGPRYAWHKALRRSLRRWPGLKRRLVYADPRSYWTLRGGDDYFREQEGQPGRDRRSRWMAARIASYRPASILEVGCGYGKQLRAIRGLTDAPLVGLDFSPTQLGKARTYLDGCEDFRLILGSGDRLPFADGTFDLVMTSAVILHNRPEIAEQIRREVVRVSRRLAAHNEDTDVSYNRFGYDTASWYASQGIRVVECGPIPLEDEGSPSQFCVAQPWPR